MQTTDDKPNLNQFFEFIDEPKFHSVEETEHFSNLLNKVYQYLNEMVDMTFTNKEVNEDTFILFRNRLLDALKRDFLIELESVVPKDSPFDSGRNIDHLEESKFETVLTTINQMARL